MILVLIIVVFGCAFLGLQIYNLKKQNTELKARKERLTELLSEETLRSEALEEEKVYKVVRATGAWDLAIGIATIILGLGAGIMLVISGAKLLSSRSKIMF